MTKAIWNQAIIAESDQTVMLEGNHYFPLDSLNFEYVEPSNTISICPWKGQASYYSLKVGSEVNADAAWFYPNPKEAAAEIKGHVAFWRGVEVI